MPDQPTKPSSTTDLTGITAAERGKSDTAADEPNSAEFAQGKPRAYQRRSDRRKVGKPGNPNWQKGKSGNPAGRKPGTTNKLTVEIRELARSMTTGSPAWCKATAARLKAGKEAPVIVQTLLHYAHGKPRDTISIEGSESLAELLKIALGKP